MILIYIMNNLFSIFKDDEKYESKGKQYINLVSFNEKCLGYKKKNEFDDELNIKRVKGKDYISLDDGLQLLGNSKEYNKRNPEVIKIHEMLGIKGIYSKEAITLKPIIDHLNSKNIKCELQHVFPDIQRRADLFIPTYNIVIECDENGHISRDSNDEEQRNNELSSIDVTIIRYNPDEVNFDVKNVIQSIDQAIQNRKCLSLDDIKKELLEYGSNNLEAQYYEQFGESIFGQGFTVDFDNVWKMCGYSKKSNAKRILENFIENDDFCVKNVPAQKRAGRILNKHGGSNKEIILLTKDTFKAFCMMANTAKGKEIRRWYIRMESKYSELITRCITTLSESNNKIISLNKSKILNISKERKLKQDEFKMSKKMVAKPIIKPIVTAPKSVSSTKKIKAVLPTVAKSVLPTVAKSVLPTVAKSVLPTVAKSVLPTVAKLKKVDLNKVNIDMNKRMDDKLAIVLDQIRKLERELEKSDYKIKNIAKMKKLRKLELEYETIANCT
jgi:very-short-patch-repair endonuclease/phage anti-repressor protein